MANNNKNLQFGNFSSAVEAVFWHQLSQRKLELYKLDDKPRPIQATYTTGHRPDMPAMMILDSTSFLDEETMRVEKVSPYYFLAPGELKNLNTAEDFSKLDKAAFMNEIGEKIWKDICNGEALKKPWLLNRFLCLTYADLKKYKYHYWFAFPALTPKEPFQTSETKNLSEFLTAEQISKLRENYESLRGLPQQQPDDMTDLGFFLVNQKDMSVAKLTEFDKIGFENAIFAFADAGSMTKHAGWSLRNYLVFIKKQWNLPKVKVIAYRENPGKNDLSNSLYFHVDLSHVTLGNECPKVLGWEKNPKGHLAPRMVDLSPLMDPIRLASTAVDLNLKLMRWRLLPSLDLDIVASNKCLLFGSGTLGCNVARTLMGWGVKHITFVDNGKVSFSNPVRQSLFNYEDCLNGGKPKAEAAAAALKRIFPGMNSSSYSYSIPMPGHHVASAEQTKKDVELTEKLIKEHDVVFLLTDTRESRWLPTMFASLHNKLVINTALGFDSYLVMRHGVAKPEGGRNYGCYFCNDVVAPTDSLKDRTLDQQCTVTRPGISFVASALAVELFVAILQHKDKGLAKADSAVSPTHHIAHDMGLIPHQVRGFLTHYAQMLISGQAYDKCTACSDKILNEYKTNGLDFLLKAFDNPTYLEDLTGLTELHRQTDASTQDWDVDDTDEEESASFEDKFDSEDDL